MNFSRVSRLSSRSLSRMIRWYARSAFSRLPAEFSAVSCHAPFLSIEKYPSWTSAASLAASIPSNSVL